MSDSITATTDPMKPSIQQEQQHHTLQASPDLLICTACGTQYSTPLSLSDVSSSTSTIISATDPTCPLKACRICDDPRQFVPPTGQTFTTLRRMWNDKDGGYRNVFEEVEEEKGKVVQVWTEPKFGIGQAARIIQTPNGNVMWDLIAYLDEDTVDRINTLGGLKLIIISHPHFYTTWSDWSNTFRCPIYFSSVDFEIWSNRPSTPHVRFLKESEIHTELLPGLTAIQSGGHFPGSLMLHSSPPNTLVESLFVADTIMSVPSALNPPDLGYFSSSAAAAKQQQTQERTSSYAFMWSIPNMIPLDPRSIFRIWKSLSPFDFVVTYGVFAGSVVREGEGDREKGIIGLPERVLESMKIFVRRGGWKEGDAEILREELPFTNSEIEGSRREGKRG